jgi:iduronate 2-sulfatase
VPPPAALSSKSANAHQTLRNMTYRLILSLLATFVLYPLSLRAQETTQPNVLFISVDDLRPELKCYGAQHMHTPNMDRIAAEGTLFERAYCQQALCAPSRASLMTGLRPASSGVTNLVTHIRLKNPHVVTLSQQFKTHGYHAQSFGKIYHPGLDDPHSWSEPAWFTPGPEYVSTQTMERLTERRRQLGADRYIPGAAPAVTTDPVSGLALKYRHPKTIAMGPSTEAADVPDEEHEDGKTVQEALGALRRNKNKPFFLAVGFNRPHLPFVAPKKYWDLYPAETIKLTKNQFPPRDVPKAALNDVGELTTYWDITTTNPIPEEKQRELLRGYYASVSHVDALIGQLLRELDALGIADNTAVVLWGDHGYQLGEHDLWCKHTNFEVAARVPIILKAPKAASQKRGGRSGALVELVDLYPSLCELAGLPVPPGLEGDSFVPLLNEPDRKWKRAAFNEYPVRNGILGTSMRTDRYRYTEWATSNTKRLVGVELYDHEVDPEENVNIGLRAENTELTHSLSAQLKQGWSAARPQKD